MKAASSTVEAANNGFFPFPPPFFTLCLQFRTCFYNDLYRGKCSFRFVVVLKAPRFFRFLLLHLTSEMVRNEGTWVIEIRGLQFSIFPQRENSVFVCLFPPFSKGMNYEALSSAENE